MKNCCLLSVIIPVYNVEDYLEETLLSVINQSLGIKKIQILLVNDGSTDGSEELCLKYKNMYPENIIYLSKENGGVSSARNLGMQQAEGKYITFLDSDDVWEKDAFKELINYFEKHYDEIDVLSARARFFEAKTNFHPLDYKFKAGTRIADLTSAEELFSVQTIVGANLIKRSATEGLRFNENLKYGEDSLFINKIILKKRRYGLCSNAVFRYRRRISNNSAVNNQINDPDYYIKTIKEYHLELFRYSKELYGEIIPYVQSVAAYDIMWRLANPVPYEILNGEQLADYQALMKEVISQIDDVILFSNPAHKAIFKRSEAYSYKYGGDFLKMLSLDEEGQLMFGDIVIINTARNKSNLCKTVSARIEKNSLRLEILVANWITKITNEAPEVRIKAGKRLITPAAKPYPHKKARTSAGKIDYYTLYSADIPLKKLKSGKTLRVRPSLVFGDKIYPLSISYGKFVPNANSFSKAYSVQQGYIIKCFRTVIQIVKPEKLSDERRALKKEIIKELIKKGERNAAAKRIRYELFKRKNKERGEIWLFSDRADNAGDNAEVLFKYVCEHKPAGVRPIFAIGKAANSKVISRLKSIGEVVFFEDKKYESVFLCAKKIISSSAGEFTINPFGRDKRFFSDLFSFKYYYLQHGVACADLSAWLNRFNKNIYKIFTSGERETESFLNESYFYSDKNLALCGQARFDALYEDSKNQILILPTWRRSIKESYDSKTRSVYFDGFKETEYFKFYNSLINNERLLEKMREYGYTGLFCLHPIHKEQDADFTGNDVFSINSGYVDYNKVFAESKVMVTDYSSVLFDFAYLRKSVVYAQFDKESFFEEQIYDEGYFSYEKDGFGKVCYDLDETVDEIIRLIENGCKNGEKYLNRVNSFFAFNDSNNCERIMKELTD